MRNHLPVQSPQTRNIDKSNKKMRKHFEGYPFIVYSENRDAELLEDEKAYLKSTINSWRQARGTDPS